MDDESNSSSRKNIDITRGTVVDLGEDLLGETAATIESDRAPANFSPGEIQSRLESAKILIAEGLIEEAKKILRRLLLADSHNVPARQALEEIHELELKQIFGDESSPRGFGRDSDRPLNVDPKEILEKLDRELELGLAYEAEARGEPALRLSLFQDRVEMEKFAKKLERELEGTSHQDRLDVGIAFLEMGLHEIAARQFEAVVRTLDVESESDRLPLLSATSLLAFSLILGGRAYEATISLQPLLNDASLKDEEKIELLYLMGRAYESLRKPERAIHWYSKASEIEPDYRDLRIRVRT